MNKIIGILGNFCKVKRPYPSLLKKVKKKPQLPDNFRLGMTNQQSDLKI